MTIFKILNKNLVKNILTLLQESFAFKLYKAQLHESYNENRNMVISPSSIYRMLHAFCLATQGKTQKELKGLVSCRNRETKKLDRVFKKLGNRKIRVCSCSI